MRKSRVVAVACALASIPMIIGAVPIVRGDYIGLDQAKQVALDYVGVAADQAIFTKAELDYDDGRAEYELEMVSGTTKYEVDIQADTGTVTEYSSKATKNSTKTALMTGNTNFLGEQQVKDIAIAQTGLSSDQLVLTKLKLKNKKNKAEYEIKLASQDANFEYKIDAVSGNVTSSSRKTKSGLVKAINPQAANPINTQAIDTEQAKAIALAQAAQDQSSVIFTTVKHDVRKSEYKIKFVSQTNSYDTKIDAFTGQIVSFKVKSLNK